jgi:class 3 adenylate cyclase
MKMRDAILAALRGDPDLLPKVANSLRERIDDEDGGRMATVVQAAEALEPVIEDAVRKRPSKLGKLGLKSTHILASLAADDRRSNRRLARIAEGETVGIVFADVAGFMALTTREGDQAAAEMLAELQALVERKTSVFKGECVKHLGDGFLLAFPSASQAVRGAAGLRDAVGKRRFGQSKTAIRLRLAVHAGEPLVESDDLLGHDVNVTARLLDHCAPGEIVVSEPAKELAEKRLRRISFTKRRGVKIRGLALKVPIFTAAYTQDVRPGADYLSSSS